MKQQRGAVRICAHRGLGSNCTARAGLVVYDHLPPEVLSEQLGQFASEDVGRAARRVRHDDAHLLVGGDVLRLRGCSDHGDSCSHQSHGLAKCIHVCLLRV
ncbi:hypothetical protein D3C86_1855520 [compost metagenome]